MYTTMDTLFRIVQGEVLYTFDTSDRVGIWLSELDYRKMNVGIGLVQVLKVIPHCTGVKVVLRKLDKTELNKLYGTSYYIDTDS